jgi:hypothetical protein
MDEGFIRDRGARRISALTNLYDFFIIFDITEEKGETGKWQKIQG